MMKVFPMYKIPISLRQMTRIYWTNQRQEQMGIQLWGTMWDTFTSVYTQNAVLLDTNQSCYQIVIAFSINGISSVWNVLSLQNGFCWDKMDYK